MTGSLRDKSVDVLRFLALTGIILVHSQPNEFWTQIRQFDVPMMVFLSAVCYARVNSNENYKDYVLKRFIRLIIPTWCFLIIFFAFRFVMTRTINYSELILTFSLSSNWYTWVIRVFFLISLVAPLLVKLANINNWRLKAIILLSLLGINEILALIYCDNEIASIAIMMIGYSIVFITGIWLPSFSKSGLLLFCATNVLIYILLGGAIHNLINSRLEYFIFLMLLCALVSFGVFDNI